MEILTRSARVFRRGGNGLTVVGQCYTKILGRRRRRKKERKKEREKKREKGEGGKKKRGGGGSSP